jgi:hypothetical protein
MTAGRPLLMMTTYHGIKYSHISSKSDKLFSYCPERWLTIIKTEKWSGPNDPSLPEQNHFNPSVHNFHGEVGTSGGYGVHPFNDLLFEATKDPKGEFPFLLDENDGRPIGISERSIYFTEPTSKT